MKSKVLTVIFIWFLSLAIISCNGNKNPNKGIDETKGLLPDSTLDEKIRAKINPLEIKGLQDSILSADFIDDSCQLFDMRRMIPIGKPEMKPFVYYSKRNNRLTLRISNHLKDSVTFERKNGYWVAERSYRMWQYEKKMPLIKDDTRPMILERFSFGDSLLIVRSSIFNYMDEEQDKSKEEWTVDAILLTDSYFRNCGHTLTARRPWTTTSLTKSMNLYDSLCSVSPYFNDRDFYYLEYCGSETMKDYSRFLYQYLGERDRNSGNRQINYFEMAPYPSYYMFGETKWWNDRFQYISNWDQFSSQ